jgi:RimJ/RimL family protein N-acetyltransferase
MIGQTPNPECGSWADSFWHETSRLSIGPCDAEAAGALGQIAEDPRVLEGFYIDLYSHRLEAANNINWIQSASDWQVLRRFNLAVREKSGKAIVGLVQFAPANFSYFVNPDFWNQGYGNEMVRACCSYMPPLLGLSVLLAGVQRENFRSRRILENAGFAFAGLNSQSLKGRTGSVAVLRYKLACAPPITSCD